MELLTRDLVNQLLEKVSRNNLIEKVNSPEFLLITKMVKSDSSSIVKVLLNLGDFIKFYDAKKEEIDTIYTDYKVGSFNVETIN